MCNRVPTNIIILWFAVRMSDDIPPLIPETPPPMTKGDWEDDEEFIDFPQMPSESSLSMYSQLLYFVLRTYVSLFVHLFALRSGWRMEPY